MDRARKINIQPDQMFCGYCSSTYFRSEDVSVKKMNIIVLGHTKQCEVKRCNEVFGELNEEDT